MNSAVLSIQAKLHRVKALLDGALSVIFIVWLLCPSDAVKEYFNVFGTVVISLYLIWSGLRVLELGKRKNKEETLIDKQ